MKHRKPKHQGTRRFLRYLPLLVGSSVAATAGTFNTDFSSDPGSILGKAKVDGILKLVDLQDLTDGTATLPIQGSWIAPVIDSQAVASFTATFDARVGGGSENPSQGFSFVLADLATRSDVFREAGADLQGLTISFDTRDNQAGVSSVAEGNILGEAPGIIVKFKGNRVAFRRFAGLRTDVLPNPAKFVPVEVKLDDDGTLDVTYNGVKVYDNVSIGYTPIAGQFGFGAGTEEVTSATRDNHWIDNLRINTAVVGSSYVVDASPVGAGASPAAVLSVKLQGVGGQTVSMTFDGAAVTPQASTAGGVTTLTFDPPGLLAAGSSHTVEVKYGTKTYKYDFSVIVAPTLKEADSVAGTVNTTAGGFAVRVHQLEAAAENTADRANAQLAGSRGDNVADLTGAVGGVFAADLINFEQQGGEAGSFNATSGQADAPIPGIPGLTGSDDNIALEAIAYLDLKAGAYTTGVTSDDGVLLTAGADPRDVTALQLINLGIGTATSTFVVDKDGVYPFRLLWWEGNGGAHVEWWMQDAAGTRTLINDRSSAAGVRSYRSRSANIRSGPYVRSAKPAPGEVAVSTKPKIELILTDSDATLDPASVVVALNGNNVTASSAKSGKDTTVTFQQGSNLQGEADQTLKVTFKDNAGVSYTRQWTFKTGKPAAASGSSVGGYWTFDNGNLKASVGNDLEFIDPSLAGNYKFGTTGQGEFAAVPNIAGKAAKVLFIPFTERDISAKIGLRVKHGLSPNGGGTRVNQWTMIMDVLWSEGGGFGGLLQTHDLANPVDGDLFWRASDGTYGKGCCSLYDQTNPAARHDRDVWGRFVISADLTANPRTFAKYVNGQLQRKDIAGDANNLDSRFALPPEIFLFGDGDDNERTSSYVDAIQFRSGALTDDEVKNLGAASGEGIPLPSPVAGQWDFDNGTLKATYGRDLEFIDPSLASNYKFGTTGQGEFANVPNINGQPAKVLFIPFTERDISSKIGLRVKHGISPNGGGTKVNQWTMIMDVLWSEGGGFGGLLQTHDLANPVDGDLFWRASDGTYGKGCCSLYDQTNPAARHDRDIWGRLVISADLTASPRTFAKYVNGELQRQDIAGDANNLDSRFALPPEIFLFGDGDDNERTSSYVNAIQFRDGALTADEVKALGGPNANGIPAPQFRGVTGQWDFDSGNLNSTVGQNLEFIDPSLASNYKFGTTGQGEFATVPNINGKAAKVLFIPFTERDISSKIGLRTRHGAQPNGGGTKVNQWTMIMDVLWSEGGGFGGLLQTHDLANPVDGDLFWRASDGTYGKGCCSLYDQTNPAARHDRDVWGRLAISVDLTANPRTFAKYVNGQLQRRDIAGDANNLDSRFALPPEIFLFGDGDDNERTSSYVNSIQFRNYALTEDEVKALGAASADGVPLVIPGQTTGGGGSDTPPKMTLAVSGANLVISWSGSGFVLESSETLAPGSWTAVSGVTGSSATISPAGAKKFYRLRK